MSAQFSQAKLAEFKEAFSLFDTDGSGMITLQALATVVRSLGKNPSEADLDDIREEFDLDEKGKINFSKFLTIMKQLQTMDEESEEEIQEAFSILTKYGSENIAVADFRHVMTNLGEKLTDEEVDEILKEFDVDEDGHFSYEEFMTKMREIREFNKN